MSESSSLRFNCIPLLVGCARCGEAEWPAALPAGVRPRLLWGLCSPRPGEGYVAKDPQEGRAHPSRRGLPGRIRGPRSDDQGREGSIEGGSCGASPGLPDEVVPGGRTTDSLRLTRPNDFFTGSSPRRIPARKRSKRYLNNGHYDSKHMCAYNASALDPPFYSFEPQSLSI